MEFDKPGLSGWSLPLSAGGDLHQNKLGGEHWTIQSPGSIENLHLNQGELDSLIDAWRTRPGMEFNPRIFGDR